MKLLPRLILAASTAMGILALAPAGVTEANANGMCPFAKENRFQAPQNVCPRKKYRARAPAPAPVTINKNYHRHEHQAAVPVVVHPGPPPAPIIIEYGDPFVAQAARDGCPLVNDAIGPLQVFADGQGRYRWRGSDWAYLPRKPFPQSRICTRNGHLAWWSPPQPRPMDGSVEPQNGGILPQGSAIPQNGNGGAMAFGKM